MPSGTTTAEFNNFPFYFSHARASYNSPASPLSIPTVQASNDKGLGLAEDDDLYVGQEASMASPTEEEDQKISYNFTSDAPKSNSAFADPISVSPAAMFLSAFSSPKPSAPLPDAEGFVISGHTFGPIIGHGAFSTIRRAFSMSGGVVAVKIIRRSDHFKQGQPLVTRDRIKREASVWSTFCHEHILPLFSAHHTPFADYFFTLYCPAGSLFDILKRDGRPALPQDDAGMMFRQVVRGLRYLHEVALFVHGDIKLENVLVDESGVCRIGDFGMTRKIGECVEDDEAVQEHNDDTFQIGHTTVHRAVSLAVPGAKASGLREHLSRHRNSTSSVQPPTPPTFQPGSLPYIAPELLILRAGPLIPHPAQDIWALGVLLYALLSGRLPFTDSFEPRLQMKILSGAYDIPPNIGRGAERVLQGCLDQSDHSRWTIAMVDEVAWGIGWGPEGDDVTPADSDDEFHVPTPSRSHSRRPPDDIIIPESPEWQHEELRTRPSLEAASRRSTSRIKRSLSRAPVVVPSRSPMLTRSVSRHSRATSPSVCALSVNTTMAARSPSGPRMEGRTPSTSRSSRFLEPALILPHTFERGRPRQKAPGLSASRSPSPSIALPTTPIDSHPDLDVRSRNLGVDRSSSRGRPTYSRSHRHLYPTVDAESELDVLDETADWAVPSASEARSKLALASPFSINRGRGDGFRDAYGPFSADALVGQRFPRSLSKPSYSSSRSPYVLKETTHRRPESSPPVREQWPSSSISSMISERMRNFPTSILTPVKTTIAVDRLTRSRSLDTLRM